MSKVSKCKVTITKWSVTKDPVEDENGDLIDGAVRSEWESTFHYERREYPRGPVGKAEFIADIASAFKSEYVRFSETNAGWACLPEPYSNLDGSWTEISMHFADNTPLYVQRAVMEEVG